MDPWTMIGWLVLAIIIILLLLPIFVLLYLGLNRLLHVIRSIRDCRTPPQTGQVWRQDGRNLRIMAIFDNGNIHIKTGTMDWVDTPEKWIERCRYRRLILIKEVSHD